MIESFTPQEKQVNQNRTMNNWDIKQNSGSRLLLDRFSITSCNRKMAKLSKCNAPPTRRCFPSNCEHVYFPNLCASLLVKTHASFQAVTGYQGQKLRIRLDHLLTFLFITSFFLQPISFLANLFLYVSQGLLRGPSKISC